MDDARRPLRDPDLLGWELHLPAGRCRHAERLVVGADARTETAGIEDTRAKETQAGDARAATAHWRPLPWARLLRGLECGDTFLFDADAHRRLARAAAAHGAHLRIRPAGPPGGDMVVDQVVGKAVSAMDDEASRWVRVTAYTGLTAADG
jgi:hypothetical protein